ncbi:nucleotidyltransferase family protein [Candidatus Gottesmanbacteria bacterium]|nr:nucleotidyltransferase family protein [Candidatus Gottesmanbacteria bacterium]
MYDKLLIKLLQSTHPCSLRQYLPQKKNDWDTLIDQAFRNRMAYTLFHYLTCSRCDMSRSKMIGKLRTLYVYEQTRSFHYKKMVRRLKYLVRKNRIPIVFLKDFSEYETHFSEANKFMKFDIDILVKTNYEKKLSTLLREIGYVPQKKPTGWPNLPQEYYTQTKWNHFRNLRAPQVEVRTSAITIPPSKLTLLSKQQISIISQELWRHAKKDKDGTFRFQLSYLYLYHCLIFALEDGFRGLNNLYRLWIIGKELNQKEWRMVLRILSDYQIDQLILLITDRLQEVFGQMSIPKRIFKQTWEINIAHHLFTLKFIGYVPLHSGRKSYSHWESNYRTFLLSALVIQKPLWWKTLFFLHPKRLFFLVAFLMK